MTRKIIQANNKDNNYMVVIDGIHKPLSIYLSEIGKKHLSHSIRARINRGWSAYDAINIPMNILKVNSRHKKIIKIMAVNYKRN